MKNIRKQSREIRYFSEIEYLQSSLFSIVLLYTELEVIRPFIRYT